MGTRAILEGRAHPESLRNQRSRRRNLIQSLQRESTDPRRSPANRLAIYAIANELDAIRRYSARPGRDKEHRFKVVINRKTFQSAV